MLAGPVVAAPPNANGLLAGAAGVAKPPNVGAGDAVVPAAGVGLPPKLKLGFTMPVAAVDVAAGEPNKLVDSFFCATAPKEKPPVFCGCVAPTAVAAVGGCCCCPGVPAMPPNVKGLAAVALGLLLLPPKMGVCLGVALKLKLFVLAAGGPAVAALKLKLFAGAGAGAAVDAGLDMVPPPKLNTLLLALLLLLLLLLLLGNVNGDAFATGLDTAPAPANVNILELLAAVVAAGAAVVAGALKPNDGVAAA